MADYSGQFRTRQPPREHEEAVRMLLAGIEAAKPNNRHQQKPQQAAKTCSATLTHTQSHKKLASLSCSDKSSELGSDGSLRHNTATSGAREPETSYGRLAGAAKLSASNSTGSAGGRLSDSSGLGGAPSSAQATSGEARLFQHSHPIASRTIAVQCDLKASSVLRKEPAAVAAPADGAHQASSISSTRYGFYEYSADTLERRRRLQRSSSARQLLSGAPAGREPQLEAPTSMSEASSLSSRSGSSLAGGSSLSKSSSMSAVSGAELRGHGQPERQSRYQKLAQAQPHRHLYESSRAARARQAELAMPARPRTALSYVSTSRLRDQSQPVHSSADSDTAPEVGRPQQPLSRQARAVSHQTLSNPLAGYQASPARQPAEQGPQRGGRRPANSSCSSTDEAPAATSAPSRTSRSGPRSTLVSSSHNERVQDYSSTLERASLTAGCRLPADIGRRAPPVGDSGQQTARITINRVAPETANKPTLGYLSGYKQPAREERYAVPTSRLASVSGRQDRPGLVLTDSEQQAHSARLREASRKLNSMSLSRSAKPWPEYASGPEVEHGSSMLFYDTLGRAGPEAASTHPVQRREARVSRAASQMSLASRHLSGPQPATGVPLADRPRHTAPVGRSTSMRHIEQLGALPAATEAPRGRPRTSGRRFEAGLDSEQQDEETGQEDDYDSGSPSTRTWANPARARSQPHDYRRGLPADTPPVSRRRLGAGGQLLGAAATRSYSMRDVHSAEKPELARHRRAGPTVDQARQQPVYESGHFEGGQPRPGALKGEQRHGREQHYRDRKQRSRREPSEPRQDRPQAARGQQLADSTSHDELDGVEDEREREHEHEHEESLYVHPQEATFMNSQQLDYDSQHRLNESGLPEVHLAAAGGRAEAPLKAPSSEAGQRRDSAMFAQYNQRAHRRLGQPVTGRAMSQQSLSRPTMAAGSSRRSRLTTAGSQSGSDVCGGSSMSLRLGSRSQLHSGGRYESAHTRSPVVMYIPQAVPRSACTSRDNIHLSNMHRSHLLASRRSQSRSRLARQVAAGSGASSTAGLAATGGPYGGSHDRLSRKSAGSTGGPTGSLARNQHQHHTSDSDGSSSMLRTLMKPSRHSRRGQLRNSRHASAHHDDDNHNSHNNEHMDDVGQLASELDSYKFRRRYSVPKDAKFNWFAKLKQRVSAAAR